MRAEVLENAQCLVTVSRFEERRDRKRDVSLRVVLFAVQDV